MTLGGSLFFYLRLGVAQPILAVRKATPLHPAGSQKRDCMSQLGVFF